MLTGIFMMGVAIILSIIGHELLHWFLARCLGFATPVFSIGFSRKRYLRLGYFWKTEFQLGPYLFGGFVKYSGEEMSNSPIWRRVIVTLGGVIGNAAIAAVLLFTLMAVVGQRQDTHVHPRITQASISANKEQLWPGDVVASVNDVPTPTVEAVQQLLVKNAGHTVLLTVIRGDKRFNAAVVPDSSGRINVRIEGQSQVVVLRVPPGNAAQLALEITAAGTIEMGKVVAQMFHLLPHPGVSSADLRIHGPVAVVQSGAAAYRTSFGQFLQNVALWNISLIILNLLPLPILDGGVLVLLGLEALRGKPLGSKWKSRLNKYCFYLLLAVGAYALLNDFIHPVLK